MQEKASSFTVLECSSNEIVILKDTVEQLVKEKLLLTDESNISISKLEQEKVSFVKEFNTELATLKASMNSLSQQEKEKAIVFDSTTIELAE
jgi:hypothetical protein